MSSTHRPEAGRILSRFHRHLRHRLSVGPPGPPRYPRLCPNLPVTPLFIPFTGEPFSLQQYYARYEKRQHQSSTLVPFNLHMAILIYTSNSCHRNGSLTVLFFPISRHSKNILGSVKHSASLSVASPSPAARKPRVSLIGSVTIFQDVANTPDEDEIATCYLKRHPDAVHWLPRNKRQPHIVSLASQRPFSRGLRSYQRS